MKGDFSPSFLMPDILRLTQSSAIACASHIGSGNTEEADRTAVRAMRQSFQKLPIKGKVVIGEGERDQAPMLYIGEKVGRWGDTDPEWDIAIDPLEGTNLCAKARSGAISVLALAKKGGLFQAPDVYMDKVACGPLAKGAIDLNRGAVENIQSVAAVLGKTLSDFVVVILDRPRHHQLIQTIHKMGVRVRLIDDGDLSAMIQTCLGGEVDLVLGSGGSPEGVLAASVLKCLGGDFQGRLLFGDNEQQKTRAKDMGIHDIDRVYSLEELVPAEVLFCATGVTEGKILKGVQQSSQQGIQYIKTESLYTDSITKNYLKIQCSQPVNQ